MTNYIDRDKIFPVHVDMKHPEKSIDELINHILTIPTADVVEVVRCEKCRHYNPSCMPNGFGWCEYYNTGAIDEHYCSHGERELDNV